MSGTARKLRVDAGWRQFTEAEQNHIREIYERDGVKEAVAYCRKIHKSWSRSSICRFFRRERAADPLQDVTKDTKLRSNSGWWQFTELEQDKIRRIFEKHGQMAAAQYCRKIGKPWSHAAISRFFAKERAVTQAQDAKLRRDLEWVKKLIAIYARAGLNISEATAIALAAKLRDAINISAANPETAKGRAILTKVAPHLIALRALELGQRRVAVLEKKLAAALPKAKEVPDLPNKPESWYAATTEELGRAIFGDQWDDPPKRTINHQPSTIAYPAPIQPNQTCSQTPEATQENPIKDGQSQPTTTNYNQLQPTTSPP